jgi:1,4-dihydroxy-2-naphthoate octaprenyltransferase
MQTKTVLRTFRLPFLVLTPVCVLLGASIVIASHTAVDAVMIALVLTGAVAAHISVNALNEYHDFNSGLDLQTRRTAFSGGSGALPDHPEAVTAVLIAGLLSLLATIAIGGFLIAVAGTSILPIGIAGTVLVASYTRWINRSPWLCLIAPGTGFGSLMVVGTHLVLTGNVSGPIWLVSLVPFFLINNLLLLNQYPDINADASVGRKTFPIVFGINNSNIVYALFMAAAYATIVLLVASKQIPVTGLFALLPLVLSLFALGGAVRYSSKIGEQPRYMAANVAAAVLTPLLLGIAIAAG